jgi:hypothetical protein
LYLVAFLLLFSPVRRALSSGSEGVSSKLLALGLGGGLLAHFLYGLLDAVSLGSKPGFLFWMLLGLVAGYHRWSVDRGEPL